MTTSNTSTSTSTSTSTFVEYHKDLSVSVPAGARKVVIKYRADAKEAGRVPAVCVVPSVDTRYLEDVSTRLPRLLMEAIETYHNSMLRDQYESGQAPDVSLEALIIHYTAQAASGRLTGDQIVEWFIDDVSDDLTIALAAKLGVTETSNKADLAKLEAMVTAYRAKFTSMASGRTAYSVEVSNQLLRVFDVVSGATDSSIGATLKAKLQDYITAATSTDGLGAL